MFSIVHKDFKWIFFLVLAITLISGSLAWHTKKIPNPAMSNINQGQNSPTKHLEEYSNISAGKTSTNTPSHKALAHINNDQTQEAITSVYGTDKEAYEVKKWFTVRGSPWGGEIDNQNVYKNYDLNILESLSNNGDILAMHILADRHMERELQPGGNGEKGIELQRNTLLKAATYGSTWALFQLGLSLSSEAGLTSGQAGHKMMLDSFAYYDVAEMRGDKMPNIHNRNATSESDKIQLNEEDQQYILKKSQEIYQGLVTNRRTLGLGDFDNNVPESVKRFYARMAEIENSD